MAVLCSFHGNKWIKCIHLLVSRWIISMQGGENQINDIIDQERLVFGIMLIFTGTVV